MPDDSYQERAAEEWDALRASLKPACECGAPLHEGSHDAALSAEQPPTVAEAIAHVNACRDGIKRIEDAMDRRAGKLRVFTIEGVAYQVDARARYAYVDEKPVRVDGRSGYPVTGNDALERHTIYKAARLSLESKWFDITLRQAAHDYLNAYLDAFRVYMSCVDTATGETGPAAHSLEFGFSQVCRSFYRGELVDSLCDSAPTSYSARVKADIEARLRGEAGEVPKP